MTLNLTFGERHRFLAAGLRVDQEGDDGAKCEDVGAKGDNEQLDLSHSLSYIPIVPIFLFSRFSLLCVIQMFVFFPLESETDQIWIILRLFFMLLFSEFIQSGRFRQPRVFSRLIVFHTNRRDSTYW